MSGEAFIVDSHFVLHKIPQVLEFQEDCLIRLGNPIMINKRIISATNISAKIENSKWIKFITQ